LNLEWNKVERTKEVKVDGKAVWLPRVRKNKFFLNYKIRSNTLIQVSAIMK
jgi:hypothetical protein